MAQDTTPTAAPRLPLHAHLWPLLAAHRPAVQQERVWARLRAVVLGHLHTLVRPHLTQVLLALGLTDADWSAFYRLLRRVDYDLLSGCFVRQTLADSPAEEPYVVALDGTQVPRSSRTMPGTSWLHNPRSPAWKRGIHRAQRFVHVALLLPCWRGYSRAVPLRMVPAFPPKAVPGAAEPQTESQAAVRELGWLRTALDAAGRPEQAVLALGDGSYDSVGLWTALSARTVLLVRTAANRALWGLVPVGAHRNRRYGERAPTPQDWLHARGGWQHTTVEVRGRAIPLTYRVEGPFLRRRAPSQPLFVLVVKGIRQASRGHQRRRKPAYFLVNAVAQEGHWVLPLPAVTLVAWAWQRWEIEVTHHELKSTWGLGAVQCWSVPATVRAVQVQAWSYGLCVLAGYRAWGLGGHPAALRPAGLWWHGAPRWSLATLWRGYRHEARVLPPCAGSRGTWAETEAWLAHLDRLLRPADAA